MKAKFLSITIILILAIFISCTKDEPDQVDPILKNLELTVSGAKLMSSSNSFGFDLLKRTVDSTNPENIMVSPLSVSLALGMTYNGADGTTKTAMEQAMHLNGLTTKEINENFQTIVDYLLTVDPKIALQIANSVWYNDDYTIEQSFINTIKKYFNAQVNAVDFSDPNTISVINYWVATQTHQKIKEIIKQITPQDFMFLINAVYFKGDWTYQFDPADNTNQTFYLSNGNTKTVEMMNITTDLRMGSNADVQVLELPYGYERYSMVLVKPINANKSIDKMISGLNDATWNNWISLLGTKSETMVTIPKFKFEYEKELKDILSDMGMGIAFSDQADFSKINPNLALQISKVKHKTYIDVNEEGTEAAAVTNVGIIFTSLPPSFVADEPFLFAIRESESNAILFIGKVENPNY